MGIDLAIQVCHGFVTRIQVGTDYRVDTARTGTTFADRFVLPFHAVHVSTWPTNIRQIPFEFRVVRQFFDLLQNTFLTA